MMKNRKPYPLSAWFGAAALLGAVLVLAAFLAPAPAQAAVPAAHPRSVLPAASAQMPKDTCLGCHNQPGNKTTLPDGTELSTTIDAQAFAGSVHGTAGLECNVCHTSITSFPHPDLTVETHKQFSFEATEACKQCHAEQYDAVKDSIHMQAYQSGNQVAPACTDCHNPHTQTKLVDEAGKSLVEARVNIPKTCSKCHNEIYQAYQGSVHGSALLEEGNNDTPTCIDCHSVHSIGAADASFRLRSPNVCGKCHEDKQLMAKYGLSAEVNNTYIADFHGTTTTIFEKTAPDQLTNTPVCIDCHGVHNMTRSDDPANGLHVKENLLRTCQKCHPDANQNFPAAWMSHYTASPEKTPLVFYVNLFYKILIPTVIGGMIAYVLLDFIRRRIDRNKGA